MILKKAYIQVNTSSYFNLKKKTMNQHDTLIYRDLKLQKRNLKNLYSKAQAIKS